MVRQMEKTSKGIIKRISGPVVYAEIEGAVNDVVKVGKDSLLGEIIELRAKEKVIQVYEETIGIKPGEPIVNTHKPLSVTLGPGLLSQVFDGTQRPLEVIKEKSGIFIKRGIDVPSLDMDKIWTFTPTVKNNTQIEQGQIIGTVEENSVITHRILVPPGFSGKVSGLRPGDFTLKDVIGKVGTKEIKLAQEWPVRRSRPIGKRVGISKPLISGQRVFDFLFPVAKGGVAAIPGPFGCGKTVTQQSFAKWCDADIIIYVGCGERGNEMVEVLEEFPHLKDPKSGEALMKRTVLIANTSNMPVAAREASVYTGITLAEYFRDQGYAVALMADSTSRWAEAMREISGRLEEMPGEEGYPAYLAKRLAEFYERAGIIETLNGDEGSITVIGAVSPPGGDFSEPVTQNTLRIAKCFWALDSSLANKRHYWAINWLESYSLYKDALSDWYTENISKDWNSLRERTQSLLQKEAELQEIVQLVGLDSLPKDQQLLLFVAKMLREDFLQQNAFHEVDMFCPVEKQLTIIKAIFEFYEHCSTELETLDLEALQGAESVEFIARLKYMQNKEFDTKKLAKTKETISAKIMGAEQ